MQLSETGTDSRARRVNVMEISRPNDPGDITNLALTLPQAKQVLARALTEPSPEARAISLEETSFGWHEILGVSSNANASTVRRALTQLALRYRPDKGGQPEQMTQINAAYEAAQQAILAAGQHVR